MNSLCKEAECVRVPLVIILHTHIGMNKDPVKGYNREIECFGKNILVTQILLTAVFASSIEFSGCQTTVTGPDISGIFRFSNHHGQDQGDIYKLL